MSNRFRPVRSLISVVLAVCLLSTSAGLEGRQAFAQALEGSASGADRPLFSVPGGLAAGLMVFPAGSGSAALPSLESGLPLNAVPALPRPAVARQSRAVAPSGKVAASEGKFGVQAAATREGGEIAGREKALAKSLLSAGDLGSSGGEAAKALGLRVMGEGRPAEPAADLAVSGPVDEGASGARAAGDVFFAARAEAARYEQRRRDLAFIAEKAGIVASLPPAPPLLESWLLDQAADKRVVFSDYDDTLDKYGSVASPETVAALDGVGEAGKRWVVVTDRPDVEILESLSSVPAAKRAGNIVAANKGGRILRYDAAGEAKLIWEEPAFTPEETAKIKDAAGAVKAKLEPLGVALHDGSRNIPAEGYGQYGYGMMLRIGTSEAAVRAVAAAMQAELSARGVGYQVEPHMAKNPANPPYIGFLKTDKSLAVRHVAEMLKVKAQDALILGDSMFVPKWSEPDGVSPELAEAAARAGVDLKTPPAKRTGHAADRNMEKGLPGALTLSVGETADPRIANGYVLSGKGPEVTRRILKAVASRPASPADAIVEGAPAAGVPAKPGDWKRAVGAAGLAALIAGAVAGEFYVVFKLLADIILAAASPSHRMEFDSFGMMLPLGLAGFMSVARDGKKPSDGNRHHWKWTAAGSAAIFLASAWFAAWVPFLPFWLSAAALSAAMVYAGYKLGKPAAAGEARFALPGVRSFGTVLVHSGLGALLAAFVFSGCLAGALRHLSFTGGAMAMAAVGGLKASRPAPYRPKAPASVSGLPKATGLTDAEAVEKGRAVARYKGVLYSKARFDQAVRERADELCEKGATKAQLKLYFGAVAAAPLNGGKFNAAGVTDAQVAAAAADVASHKGGIYSGTEYNVIRATARDGLYMRGATEAQLKAFSDLCGSAPVLGGGFNRWSGD